MMKTLTALLNGIVPSTAASAGRRLSKLSLHPSLEGEVKEVEEEL